MLMHGGLIDPSAYLIASSIQHFPEPWPVDSNFAANRHGERSSNRSLAFMLANNGFDVFLAWTRGANEYNRRHLKLKSLVSAVEGRNLEKNVTRGEVLHEFQQKWDYWSFTEDDIIKHEIKAQMDKIMEITKQAQVSLFVFSLSTRTSLAFLATRPDYARKLRAYICMAPMISGLGMAGAGKMIIQNICTFTPKFLGQLVLSDLLLTPQVRSLLIDVSKNKWVRYAVTKFLLSILLGSSAKYRTNLELNILGHLFLHLNYKMVKQMCQSTFSDRFQKFDYGPIGNKLIYKSDKPPIYDLSNLQLEDWITISGTNDNLATDKSYEQLMALVNPKPITHHVAPGFNHLDLFAGFENDIYVNLPILEYLIRKSSSPYDANTKKYNNVIIKRNNDSRPANVFTNNNIKPAESVSSFRSFQLPFLDFKPENIIEAYGKKSASGSGAATAADKKYDKSYPNPSLSPLANFFKFPPSLIGNSGPFKLPTIPQFPPLPSFLLGTTPAPSNNGPLSFLSGLTRPTSIGSSATESSSTGSSSASNPLDLFMNSIKQVSEVATDVATQSAAKSPIPIPVVTDAAKLVENGKQQMKVIDDAKTLFQKILIDLTKIFTPIKPAT